MEAIKWANLIASENKEILRSNFKLIIALSKAHENVWAKCVVAMRTVFHFPGRVSPRRLVLEILFSFSPLYYWSASLICETTIITTIEFRLRAQIWIDIWSTTEHNAHSLHTKPLESALPSDARTA